MVIKSVDYSDLSDEAKMLAKVAKEASRAAVARTFAAGLPIVVAKDGNLVRIAPDGTETIIRPDGRASRIVQLSGRGGSAGICA